jgi:hypothetical protein
MKRMRLFPALACLCAAFPALAEPWDCAFTVECVAGEACGESAFEVQVIAADHAGELFLSTLTGDSRVTRLTGRTPCPPPMPAPGATGWRSF